VTIPIALALLVSAITGGRWTWILGGGVALISLLALVSSLSWFVKPVGAYVGVWLGFNVLRAWADNTAWAEQVVDLVPRLEKWLFGGRLPSAILQTRLFEPAHLVWYDYALTAVYLSFFIVPHAVVILLLWRDRQMFWHYLLATAGLFVLALIGFFAIPTSPPWLIAESVPDEPFTQIQRVAADVLHGLHLPVHLYSRNLGEAAEVRIEPNSIAAMPSIHFAVTVLLVFLALRAGPLIALAAMIYAASMGFALVFLGEHYVLDLVVGGTMAMIGWEFAGAVLNATRDLARRGAASPASPWPGD
jgi:membrane-associated phospholipid phosphatase